MASPAAEELAVAAMLASGRYVFEQLGPGFTLLALGASSAAVQTVREATASLAVPLSVIENPAGGETERYGARWVLVRPDQFVAWVSCEANQPGKEVRDALRLARGKSSRANAGAQVPRSDAGRGRLQPAMRALRIRSCRLGLTVFRGRKFLAESACQDTSICMAG